MPYGYITQGGYVGRLADGSFLQFETEQAYLDYITE